MDRKKVKSLVRENYAAIGLKPPEEVIFCEGLVHGAVVAALLDAGLTETALEKTAEEAWRAYTGNRVPRGTNHYLGVGLESMKTLDELEWTCLVLKGVFEREGETQETRELKRPVVAGRDLFREIATWFPFARAAVIVEKPTRWELDEAGLPHSESGPAIAWRDGLEMFYIHGECLPEEEWLARVQRP
jgi:hypothetical protein